MMSKQGNTIYLNDEVLQLSTLMSVSDLIEQAQIAGSRFVVVINDEIVPKTHWADRQVRAGDKVDIVSPISGG